MAEERTNWNTMPGPKWEATSCTEKLYLIASLFFASRHFSSLAEDEPHCAFSQLLDEHQKPLIIRLLIETAVLIRIRDDLTRSDEELYKETKKYIVGRL